MLGDEIVSRINQLGMISETPEHLARIFLSPEHRIAADLILSWMRDAGMAAHLDAIGNVCGRYEGDRPGLPCLMLGSHYDTVRDAGKWDGPLGIITAIACVADLNRRGVRLAVRDRSRRFRRRGGRAVCLHAARQPGGRRNLRRERAQRARCEWPHHARGDGAVRAGPGQIGAAARARRELHAYVELHIEQGPVLEQQNLPVGVVTAISGATRLAANLSGMAGHAGTVPMALRRDALAGAAECIVAVEEFCKADGAGLVGTVGAITALPGATNVIPGRVSFTLDIRAPTDAHRKLAVADIVGRIEAIAKRRDLSLQIDVTHENRTVPCAPWLKAQVAEAVAAESYPVFELPSGAGHDGMAMIDIADVAMLFVRCRGGISHNPAEHVEPADADAGARVLLRLIENFRPRERRRISAA